MKNDNDNNVAAPQEGHASLCAEMLTPGVGKGGLDQTINEVGEVAILFLKY